MKIPKRVLDAAINAYLCTERGHRMKAAITAALQEWIASGEAFDLGTNPNGKKHILIRMEPENASS